MHDSCFVVGAYTQNHKSIQIVFCFQKMKVEELEDMD